MVTLLAALAAAASLTCAQPAPAAAPEAAHAAKSSARELEGSPVEFKTPDNWTIRGVYVAAAGGGKTALLLHGRSQKKEEWLHLARLLQKEGYGYIAIDLRGHGDSATGPDGQAAPWQKFKATKLDNQWLNMELDAQGAVSWTTSQNVPEESIVVVGDDIGGIIGLKYAAVHPKIANVIMLSPAMQYLDVTSVNAMRAYKDRPVLMIYSELDRASSRDTPILYEFAKRSAGEKNAYVVSVPKVHGYRLASLPTVDRQIVDWIANPVKPEPPAASTETVSGSTVTPPTPEPGQLPEQAEPQPQ